MRNKLFIFFIFLAISNHFWSQLQQLNPVNNEVLDGPVVIFEWDDNAFLSFEITIFNGVNASNIYSIDTVQNTNSFLKTGFSNGEYYWKIKNLITLKQTSLIHFVIFDIDGVANKLMWLKPENGLIVNGANYISQWTNQVGLPHAVQSNSSNQPLKIDNALNGLPVVRMDGLDDYLKFDTLKTIRDAFFVFKHNTGNQEFASILGDEVNPNYHGGFTNQMFSTTWANSNVLNGVVRSNSITKNFATFLRPTQYTVMSLYTAGNCRASTMNKDRNYTTRFWNGDYVEMLLFNQPKDSLSRNSIEKYLSWKYTRYPYLGKDTLLLCGHSINLSVPSDNAYSSITWSTGATNVSTISVAQEGNYWVEVNSFGIILRDSIKVFNPLINQPENLAICFNDSTLWDTGLGSDYSYNWSTGETNSFLYIDTPGTYYVSVTDSLGCSRNSVSLNFYFDYYAQIASLGIDTALCSGNLISLQIAANETTNYFWNGSPAAGQPASFAIDTTGDYYVETTNIHGCTGYDTIHVTIAGQAPLADFFYQNQCLNSPNSFTDMSVGIPTDTVVSWQWNFGDGQTSTDQHTSHVYSSAGNYTVQLYILSNFGCGAFQTQTLSVFTPPQANFSLSGLCSKNTTELYDLTLLGDEDLETYQWDFGQPSLGANNYSSVQNPSVYLPNAGTFIFSFSVSDSNGCVSDTSFSVTVNPSPTVDFTIASACVGQPSAIVNNSIVNSPATYLWDFGDGTSSSLAAPVKSYTQYGNQDVSLTITSANGCVSDSVVSVAIHPYPVPYIEMGPACVGTYLVLKDTSSIPQGSIANVTWILNLTDTLYGDSVNYLVSTFDQQQVKMIVESVEGCASTVSKFFTATTELDAAFTVPSSIVAEGIPIPFSNTSVGGTSYAWDFGDGNSSALPSPNHIFGQNWIDSLLQVQLIATNTIGCRDTTYQIVQIKSRLNDLVLGNLFYQKTGNLAVVGVEIKNEGSAPFSNVDLFLSSEKGPLFQETWNGTLQPYEHFIYLFQSKPVYNPTSADELTAFYCVEGSIAELESNYANNRVCKNTENSEVILLPIYPNPASDVLELNLLVAENSTISIDMIDERGRKILDFYQNASLTSGLYKTSQDIRRIEAGCYFIRMTVNDAVTIQRILIVR
ncbi:MAG: PKD domain-containing protein [Crocinitomicaceae bacterium]